MNNDLGITHKLAQGISDVRKLRLIAQEFCRQTVYCQRTGIGITFRIDVVVKVISGQPAVHHFDTADLNDAVAASRVQSGRLSVKNNLSHGCYG